MTEPRPCPFCGGAPAMTDGHSAWGDWCSARVFCSECKAQGPEVWDPSLDEAKRKAIDAWNGPKKKEATP